MKQLEHLDINGNTRKWKAIKQKEFKQGLVNGLSKHNSELAIAQLKDFENGINCTTQGFRTPASLIRIRRVYRVLSDKCKNKDIDKLTQEEMSNILKKENSEHFARNVKVIFNWLYRTDRIKENPTKHILAKQFSNGKPSWVFLGEDKMKLLINAMSPRYKALVLFLFDSGIRPEEAWRLRIFDFQEDYTILDLPEKRNNGERVAKKNSIGRKIKLKLCSSLIKEYVQMYNLKQNDLLFSMSQAGFNKALRVTAEKLFGKTPTKARESPNRITAYDIRHNSSCFWLKRYKTNKDLMYRFGWKSEDKVFYYSEFMDMRDTIDDNDLLTSEEKTKLEKEVERLRRENKEMQVGVVNLSNQILDLQNAVFKRQGKPIIEGRVKLIEVPTPNLSK